MTKDPAGILRSTILVVFGLKLFLLRTRGTASSAGFSLTSSFTVMAGTVGIMARPFDVAGRNWYNIPVTNTTGD